MPILHLGVIDLPYISPPPAPRAKKATLLQRLTRRGPPPKKPRKSKIPKPPRAQIHRRWRQKYENLSTGDVAEILEAKYHVMEIFAYEHENDIANDVTNSLQGSIESYLMGAPLTLNPFGSATSSIENRMKQFLSNREMDSLGYPGIPTMAAQMGISHRLKDPGIRSRHAFKWRPARPSFIDTGLYQASMTAWVD
jgi:hypothetical protein